MTAALLFALAAGLTGYVLGRRHGDAELTAAVGRVFHG